MLAAWSGWGALPRIFEPPPAPYGVGASQAEREAAIRWTALDPPRQRLRELLSEGEWADARRNALNAHYTDPTLAAAIWEGVRRFGFDGGHVLEPSSGSGIYIGLAPTGTSAPIEMTGVEVEGRTAAISRHLYPDATIYTGGFESVSFTDPFDVVIGNIPYGRYQRYDRIYNSDLQLSIHDHFVLKSLALTRPGGITALITSRYTLDGKDPSARQRMYELGDLVGAVRLPAGAHQATAGTDVVTDVLYLRRRIEGEPRGDSRWLTATEQILPGVDQPVLVNDYITAHSDHVLGELRCRIGPFGPEPTVVGERDAAAGLAMATATIADAARAEGLTFTARASRDRAPRPALATEPLTEEALGLDEQGRPTIVEDGSAVPLDIHPDQRERLVQLIGLKQRTLALYEAEANTPQAGETPQLTEMRTALREAYRAYRRKNPPPGKPGQRRTFVPKEAKDRAAREGLATVPDQWKAHTAFSFIDNDPDASLLFGLEAWDDRTGTATEQKILHERVLEPHQIPDSAKTPEDAVALAQEWDGGRLDMARVASLLGIDENEAARQCGHLAFRDPAQNGFWEPRHRYLSGNVREKLALARTSAADDPSYTVNVSALERVQPQDLNPAEIKARCGAPWIPVEDYRAFLNHLGFEHAEVRHAGGTMWEVRGAHVGDLARSEWGTAERSAQDLILSILRQADSTIQVTYRDNEGNTRVNQVATDAAREKARLIREAWDDWIWADKARSERLADIYNALFNALVLPDYDTSPLRLPGSSDWTMRPHQNAAIRRIVSEPTALLAHVVGAGKTATMVGGIMELRRTGLARKPAMVIPNHMLRQITREFHEIYPNAKLLAISASDLGVKRRAKFMARAAGGDWDAVIMTHEAFNRVPLRPETQLDYIDTELSSLREQLDEASAAGMEQRTIKQIETDLAAIEARMLKQVDESANGAGIFLEDTGIDYLMVDEAHAYKNLRTISAIPGAGIQGSVKATKLHMVLGHLRKTNGADGKVCTLATGTPIANSVTEAYVLKRYLAPDLLERQGLTNFDSWAATFGEVVSALEPDAKGDGYKYKARFARFFNVPELMTAYRSFADVQNAEDLKLPVPPIQLGADGQRGESIAFPVTGHQRAFIKALPHQACQGARRSPQGTRAGPAGIPGHAARRGARRGGWQQAPLRRRTDRRDLAGHQGHRLPDVQGRPHPAETPRRPPARLPRRRHARIRRGQPRGSLRRSARAPRRTGRAAGGDPLHPRGEHRPQEGQAVRGLPRRPRIRPCRLHREDGHRHQHPGPGRRPAPLVLPVAARRHGPARRPRRAAGQPQRPLDRGHPRPRPHPLLRHRRQLRRVPPHHPRPQGKVHRPDPAQGLLRTRDRGHRRGGHQPGHALRPRLRRPRHPPARRSHRRPRPHARSRPDLAPAAGRPSPDRQRPGPLPPTRRSLPRRHARGRSTTPPHRW
nr:DEAD/DEAH box helicase family protein [Streptomyces sp. MMG1522]